MRLEMAFEPGIDGIARPAVPFAHEAKQLGGGGAVGAELGDARYGDSPSGIGRAHLRSGYQIGGPLQGPAPAGRWTTCQTRTGHTKFTHAKFHHKGCQERPVGEGEELALIVERRMFQRIKPCLRAVSGLLL